MKQQIFRRVATKNHFVTSTKSRRRDPDLERVRNDSLPRVENLLFARVPARGLKLNLGQARLWRWPYFGIIEPTEFYFPYWAVYFDLFEMFRNSTISLAQPSLDLAPTPPECLKSLQTNKNNQQHNNFDNLLHFFENMYHIFDDLRHLFPFKIEREFFKANTIY